MFQTDRELYKTISKVYEIQNFKSDNKGVSFTHNHLLSETIQYDLENNIIGSTLLLEENQVEFFVDFMERVNVVTFDPKPKDKELQFCAIKFNFKPRSHDEVIEYMSLYDYTLKSNVSG